MYTYNLLLDDFGIVRRLRDVTMINVHHTGDNHRYCICTWK